MPPSMACTSFTIPPRVLIAAPEFEMRHNAAASIAAAGCDVVEASDGRDALVKALMRPPSLVVAELRLPFIDGVSLCRILREDRATKDMPIVVVAADAEVAPVERARRAGADAVVSTLLPPEPLLAEVRRLLMRSRDLRDRSAAAHASAADQLARSVELMARSEHHRRPMKSHLHERVVTTAPPAPPPELICPECDSRLRYERSHIGGVSASHSEQWDYYECASCGTFQFRHRTRKLRRIS